MNRKLVYSLSTVCTVLCHGQCTLFAISSLAISANDKTVKKLAKEMRVRVKTAKGDRVSLGFAQ